MPEPRAARSQSIRVLLIEDTDADARLVQDALIHTMSGTKFELERCDRLSRGLERLAAGNVDVVLLDLTLPDSQGLDTLSKTHAKAHDVPILVLTATDDEALAVEALQRGAEDYLAKGYIEVYRNLLDRSIRYAIERKRSSKELSRLAALSRENPYPIIEVDRAGVVTYLNPAARTKAPDLERMGAAHPILEGLPAIVAALEQHGEGSCVREIALEKRTFEQHISFHSGTGLVRSYMVDITERKQVEHLKDEFLSTVSHELRTPLAVIKEFIGIITDGIAGPVTPDQQQYFGIIKANIDRLGRMINDVLDMAKIESGRVVVNKDMGSTRKLIDQVVRSMQPLAAAKRIELDVRVPDPAPDVFADGDKITQVLMNLVSNAIKFTPEAGRVTISVAQLQNELRFCVSDNGVGIASKDLPRLFEKFQQIRPTEKGNTGTGLGLAISKRFIELHGGRIWAESDPTTGSRFYFTLPVYRISEIMRDYLRMGIVRAKENHGHLSVITLGIQEFFEMQANHSAEELQRLFGEIELRIRQQIRPGEGDVVVRWQSGDVIVILANADRAGAASIAARLKQLIESQAGQLSSAALTVLTGSATYPDDAPSEQDFVRMLEDRLRLSGPRATRIMIVDDEPKIRQFLQELLTLHKFEVITAANGPDALEQLKYATVDLILLDIQMPVMDGYQVYHLLRENPRTRDIPVIIVTAQGERADRQLGMATPSYNYVTKPFEIGQLLAKIRDVLDRPSAPVTRTG